jgi:hypothetical protein
MQDDETDGASLKDKVVAGFLDQLPAAKASAVKVTVGVPDLQLERATDFHEVTDDGDVSVQRDIELQLGAVQATVELKVRELLPVTSHLTTSVAGAWLAWTLVIRLASWSCGALARGALPRSCATAASRREAVQVSNERGFRIGAAQVRAVHLPDGTTAFWGTTADKMPIAKRWQSGEEPWRIALGLEGTENASIELEMRMDPWQYSLDLTAQQQFRKGLRSVVAVQVRARPAAPSPAYVVRCDQPASLCCRVGPVYGTRSNVLRDAYVF